MIFHTMKRFTPPKRKRYGQIALSETTKQILLGGILGDGSLKIGARYNNARYCERHGLKQYAYLSWKVHHLRDELGGSLVIRRPDATGYSRLEKCHYQSRVHPGLTALHHLTHQCNAKRLRRRWLNHVDALALAVWWFDDGCLNARTRQGVFCTDGFTYDEIALLARYLLVDWNVASQIKPSQTEPNAGKRRRYRLHLDRQNLDRFLNIILPYTPVRTMLYKVLPCYGNLEDQQRWISTVAACLPHHGAYLAEAYGRRLHVTPCFVDHYMVVRKEAMRALENDIVQHV